MITLYQPIGITSYQLYIVSVVPVVVSCSYNKIVLVTVSKISFHPYKPRLALLACIRQRDLGRTSRVALVAAYVNLTLKLLLMVEDPDRAIFKPPHGGSGFSTSKPSILNQKKTLHVTNVNSNLYSRFAAGHRLHLQNKLNNII